MSDLDTRRDERGSIIIAMTMIAVLALLAAAVMARTLSGQNAARQGQEISAALGVADAGVADALFRLDQVGSGTPPSSFCAGAVGCAQASLPGAPDTQYKATYDATTDTVTVRSKGRVNGRPQAVYAEIKRSGLFPFALFGASNVSFNGNSAGNIFTVNASGTTVTTPSSDVGTNGTITCNANSGGGGDNNVAYPGGSVGSSCANPTLLTEGEYSPEPPVAMADCSQVPLTIPETPCVSTSATCPAVTGVLPTTLNPGRYLCTSSVSFAAGYTQIASGTTNGGVVEIFVVPPSGSANVALDNAFVNVAPGANATNTNDDIDGDPTKLRLYVAGGGTVQPGNGNNAKRFVGIVWAPQSDMTSNGCQEFWRGALVFNSVSCNGGPNLNIAYDVRVAELRGSNWGVDNYHQIPSSQVSVP